MASEPSATGHAASGARSAGEREPRAAQRAGTHSNAVAPPRLAASMAFTANFACKPKPMASTARGDEEQAAEHEARAPHARARQHRFAGTAAPRTPARAAPAGCRCHACRGSTEKNSSTMQHPEERQPDARIAFVERGLEARHQPEQQQAPRQPQRRDHFDDEVVPGLHVMPGGRITAHGLLEQDLVAIGGVFGRTAASRRRSASARTTATRRAASRAARATSASRPCPRRWRRGPSSAKRAQRKYGISTSTGRKPTPLVKMPSPAANPPMKYQRHAGPSSRWRSSAYSDKRREETQRRIDLRAARHHARTAACRRVISAAARPASRLTRAAAEIVDQEQHAARGEERRNQERRLHRAEHRVADRQQPEEQRRLVLVEIAADAREQPLVRQRHVARQRREARFVRGPGIANAEARADDDDERERQPQQIARSESGGGAAGTATIGARRHPAAGAVRRRARRAAATNDGHRAPDAALTTAIAPATGAANGRGDFAGRRHARLRGRLRDPAADAAGRGGRDPGADRYQALEPARPDADVHDEVVERHRRRQQIGQHADRVVLAPDEIRRDHGAAQEADDPEAARNRSGGPRACVAQACTTQRPANISAPRKPTSFHGVTTTPK